MEPASSSSWLPPVLVLAAAALGTVVYLWRSAAGGAARRLPAAPDPEAAQRRAERLMEQLRELDAERHLLDAAAYSAQRERLESQAAEALRARDASGPIANVSTTSAVSGTSVPAPSAPSGFLARSPQLKGALWGGGVVLFFVALGLFLGQDRKPREDGAITGKTPPMGGSSVPNGDDAELEALRVRLEQAPDDVAATARAAHLLLKRQDLESARQLTQRGLLLDPFDTESRIHRALLRATQNDVAGAEAELLHLADTYPHAAEGLLYLGMLRMERGDKRGALAAFERYAVEAPPAEQPPMLAQTLAALRSQAR